MQLYVDLLPESKLCYTLTFGNDLVIDPEIRTVYLHGRKLLITRKEFDLLFWLASNPGKVYTRDQLYDRVWNNPSFFNVDNIGKGYSKTLRFKISQADTEYKKCLGCWLSILGSGEQRFMRCSIFALRDIKPLEVCFTNTGFSDGSEILSTVFACDTRLDFFLISIGRIGQNDT